MKIFFMPWYHGDYPPSYKNLPPAIREKAVEIANALLEENMQEGEAIAIGAKNAKSWFEKQGTKSKSKDR